VPWRGLTREQIAREALALIDEQGLGALTMRAVAGRMGVGVMSLYHHVPNRKALAADVVEAVLAEIDTPRPQDGDWREPLRAMLASARRTLLRHPATLPLIVARQPTASTAALGRLNATIGILMHAGFDAATAARIHRNVSSYLLGYVSLELSDFHPGASGTLDLPDREKLAAAYPYLTAAAPHLADYDVDADFEAGLQALLTGLARRRRIATID
jgi:TetR/AcrR family transcriptional regulator, tetracycline repressor protein